MKKQHISYKKLALIIVTLFTFAPLAHAAMRANTATVINSNINVNANAGATVTPITGVHMEGGVNTAGGMKMEDGQDMNMKGGTGMTAAGTSSMEQNIGHGGEYRGENEDENDALLSATLHIDLNNNDDKDDGGGQIDTAEEVHSDTDFHHYVAHEAKADAYLKSVDVKDNKVDVEFEDSGKWFGFINASVSGHASADVSGNVEVKYPWYHIFMKMKHSSASIKSEISQKIEAGKQSTVAAGAAANAKVQYSIPRLFEAISHSLNASVNSTTEVKAS